MIKELVEYAERKGLITEPGFDKETIHWCIVVNNDGTFNDVIELITNDKRGREFKMCPKQDANKMKGGGLSHFLADTVETVTLYNPGKKGNKKEEDRKGEDRKEKRHECFKELLKGASEEIKGLQYFLNILNDDEIVKRINETLKVKKAKKEENISFMIDDKFIIDDKRCIEWWKDYRNKDNDNRCKKKNGNKESTMLCYLTGQKTVPCRTHPPIKNSKIISIGGQSTGTSLVCFDKDSFCSYGLKKGENACYSEMAAKKYQAGLNDVISNGVQIGSTIVCHWYKEEIKDEEDPFSFLTGLDSDEAKELTAVKTINEILKSIYSEKTQNVINNRYYSIIISATGARIMLREWLEDDYSSMVVNINKWFEDFSIVSPDGNGKRYPGIYKVVYSLVDENKKEKKESKDKLITYFVGSFLKCALKNQRIPEDALAKAVYRFKSDMFSEDNKFNAARMGLIKAYHNRKNYLSGGDNLNKIIDVELNPDFDSNAYQLGRLMAVLASLQRKALGDVGAGVIERYYSAASTTPKQVFGGLTKLSQFHLSKLEKGLAFWYEGIISEIWSKITSEIPSVLTLEEQSLFAMGYYQQIAALRKSN